MLPKLVVLVAIYGFTQCVSTQKRPSMRRFFSNPFVGIFCDVIKCPDLYAPVCGSDMVTYDNSCFLAIANCRCKRRVPRIKVAHRGKCNDKPDDPECKENMSCIELYDPVCGSDGKTYSNSCFLKIANCQRSKNSPVISLKHEGECQIRSKCDIACTKIYAPVCGSDGKTYANSCVLSATSCQKEENNEPSVQLAYEGKCTCDDVCFTLYDPVCGSDGNTYSNQCRLRVASCEQTANGQPPVSEVHKGECS